MKCLVSAYMLYRRELIWCTYIGHVLVDLDAGAGLSLQHLDRLAAAADHTAHQVLGALHRLFEQKEKGDQ